MSSKIGQFFNPAEHLVFHQDKEGNMIGGGYQVNNLLYQQKRPLFVSLEEQTGGGAAGGGNKGSVGSSEPHFIPQKFSDLFRDLAVPAGLFMMPPMFRPRNYAFEVPEEESSSSDGSDDDGHDGEDHDGDHDHTHKKKDYKSTKHAPNDIFDTLLSLVESKERIQHDVKTRRHRPSESSLEKKMKNNKNTTKRRRMK
jgi:hypothetical protein